MEKIIAKDIELIIDSKRGAIFSLKLGGIERLACICPIFNIRLRNKEGECFYIDSTNSKLIDVKQANLNTFLFYSCFSGDFDKINAAIKLERPPMTKLNTRDYKPKLSHTLLNTRDYSLLSSPFFVFNLRCVC